MLDQEQILNAEHRILDEAIDSVRNLYGEDAEQPMSEGALQTLVRVSSAMFATALMDEDDKFIQLQIESLLESILMVRKLRAKHDRKSRTDRN